MNATFSMKQKGLSLIELMIAMGLGVLLLLALSTIFITAHDSSKRRSTSENLDEVARQVIERLSYDLHKAGYVDPFSSVEAARNTFDVENKTVFAIYSRQKSNLNNKNEATTLGRITKGAVIPLLGCNGDFNGSTKPSLRELASCNGDDIKLQQSIQVGYQTVAPGILKNKETATNPPSRSLTFQTEENESLSGAGRDCIGRVIGQNTTADSGIVVNRYSVRLNDGIGSFGCASSVGEWQGIIEGVQEMTFRYLITPSNNTASDGVVDMKKSTSGLEVSKYLLASKVNDEDLGWANVVGVEVCLVVAVEPMDNTKESSLARTQPMVPTCERKNMNATTAKEEFKDDIKRKKDDFRLYKRYVQIISMPNSLYNP